MGGFETARERFFTKVDKTDSCWLWTASVDPAGYGRFRLHKAVINAHRVSYEWARGPIPEGLEIDHLCRVRNCVNPDHLEAVSHKENVLRGDGPAGKNARRTHCKHGHKFTEENPHRPSSGRYCRTCHNERVRRRWQRKRANV